FINIWRCISEEDKQRTNLTALSLDEDVRSLSMSRANTVLAISETGTLSLFGNVTSTSLSTSQSKKKKRYATRAPDCIVKVINEKGSTIIPIISACFVDQSENKEAGWIIIARGNTVKPTFEKVRFIDEESGNFLQELTLTRHQPNGFLVDESNLASKNL
ncbi:1389_t:CDS:2, partial [Acaulospora colombiana]